MTQERMQQTEIGVIPESWSIQNFSDICKYTMGKTPPRNKPIYWEKGIIPWLTIQDMKQGKTISTTKEKISEIAMRDCLLGRFVSKGTLLMSFKLTIGRTCFAGCDLVHNEAIIAISPNPQRLGKLFLGYYLSNIDYNEYQDRQVKGNTLNKQKINKIKIPLPPLSEQKKIAAILSKIQQSIDVKEELIKTTKELKKSMMQHLFTYGTKGETTKQTEIGEIPESWSIQNFSDICKYTMGKTPPRNKPIYWEKGIIPWLTIQDMKQGKTISTTKEKISEIAMRDCLLGRFVSKGTLLMSFKLTIGRTCFAGCDLVHNEAIIAISPNPQRLGKLFLGYYLSNIDYNEYQDRQVKGNTLNKQKINKIKIPLPPLSEQKKIAAILSKIDERIENYEAQKSALQALFKSMLNKLMTGQIRVHKLDIDVSEIA